MLLEGDHIPIYIKSHSVTQVGLSTYIYLYNTYLIHKIGKHLIIQLKIQEFINYSLESYSQKYTGHTYF